MEDMHQIVIIRHYAAIWRHTKYGLMPHNVDNYIALYREDNLRETCPKAYAERERYIRIFESRRDKLIADGLYPFSQVTNDIRDLWLGIDIRQR